MSLTPSLLAQIIVLYDEVVAGESKKLLIQYPVEELMDHVVDVIVSDPHYIAELRLGSILHSNDKLIVMQVQPGGIVGFLFRSYADQREYAEKLNDLLAQKIDWLLFSKGLAKCFWFGMDSIDLY